MQVLREIGRIREPVERVVDILHAVHDIEVHAGELSAIVEVARTLSWTRDPMDRLIVAHAVAESATLLTADARILECCESAFWP
jgi:PIN domain nuclease of toxin-antitoxin system